MNLTAGDHARELIRTSQMPVVSARASVASSSEVDSSAVSGDDMDNAALRKMFTAVTDTLESWKKQGRSDQLDHLKTFCSLGAQAEEIAADGISPRTAKDSLESYLNVANALTVARFSGVRIDAGEERLVLSEMQEFLAACIGSEGAPAQDLDVSRIVTFCRAFRNLDQISNVRISARQSERPAPTLRESFPWANEVLELGQEILRARFAPEPLQVSSASASSKKTTLTTTSTTTTTTTTTTTAHMAPLAATPTVPQSAPPQSAPQSETQAGAGDGWDDWDYDDEIDSSSPQSTSDSDPDVDSDMVAGSADDWDDWDYDDDLETDEVGSGISSLSESGLSDTEVEAEFQRPVPRDTGDD